LLTPRSSAISMMRTVLERLPVIQRLGRSPIGTDVDGFGSGIDRRGVGVVLLADLDHVDGPLGSRLVGVRWVATADEHAPRGIEPALDVLHRRGCFACSRTSVCM
jgi:hypothetical protein